MAKRSFILLTIVASLLCMVTGVVFLMPPPLASQTCDPRVASLVITTSALPRGSRMTRISDRGSFLGHGAVDVCVAYFSMGSGVALQVVHRYADEVSAAEGFRYLTETYFDMNTELDTPWVTADPFPGGQLRADDYRLACSRQGLTDMCRAVGRYGTVTFLFNTHIGTRTMTQEDLERVLKAIDEQLQEARSTAR